MRDWRHIAAVVALASLAASSSPAFAQAKKKPATTATSTAAEYGKRYGEVCASCHGANGRSDMAGVPVLAGQPSMYVMTQLFLFREGRRKNEAMVAIAKTMKDADLKGFSAYIDTLPPVPPPPPATPPDAARMARGKALSHEHKCTFCHGADLSGGQQVPRVGGQKEDYLLQTLKGFKSGDRPGYTRAMTEAMGQVPVEDIDDLAHFAANIPDK